MKKIFTLVLACVASCTFLLSCKKEKETTTPTTQAPSYYIKAKVNGADFTGAVTSAQVPNSTYSYLIITGVSSATSDARSISLLIDDYNSATGTFNIDTTAQHAAIYAAGNVDEHATSGQIKVASANTVVTGTFNFITPSYTVTEGTFNVKLQ